MPKVAGQSASVGSEPPAQDLIDRFRQDFGATGEAMETAHAGSMWHIISLAHLIIGELESMLADSDLSPADLFVLGVLVIERDRKLRPSDVARILSVTPAAVSLRLRKLEMRGFVKRRGDEGDHRIVRIELTPMGAEQARSLLGRVGLESHFSHAVAKLDGTLRKNLEQALGDLSRAMERHVIR